MITPNRSNSTMRTLTAFLAILGLAGALHAKKPKAAPKPLGNEASFAESFSPVEVTIKSTGVGEEPELAEADIPLVALQFVMFKWSDKLVNTDDENRRAQSVLDEIYSNPKKFVTWTADRVTSTRRLPDDRYEVTRMIRINKGELTEFLVKKGVISSRQDLAKGAGNPMIMVIPDAPKGSSPLKVFDENPLAQQCAGAIESYLTQRQYEVVSPRGQENLGAQIQMIASIKSPDEDQTYQIAMATGADIYVTFAGEVAATSGGRKASLVVKAYETSTARLLGTETGYSQTRANATDGVLVEEATNDAIDKVLQRVTNYWKTDAERGIQYKVVLRYNGNFGADRKQDLSDAVEELVEKEFAEHKVNISTDKTEDIQVWAAKERHSSTGSISRVFRKRLEAPGVKVREILKNRKLLILELVEG
jgi:hypothetical protein